MVVTVPLQVRCDDEAVIKADRAPGMGVTLPLQNTTASDGITDIAIIMH